MRQRNDDLALYFTGGDIGHVSQYGLAGFILALVNEAVRRATPNRYVTKAAMPTFVFTDDAAARHPRMVFVDDESRVLLGG